MEDLTVIIPLHKYDQTIGQYLTRALESIENQIEKPNKILVVAPGEPLQDLTMINVGVKNITIPIEYIKNEGETDYCSQINLGVKNVTTKYFSILEYDDYYQSKWFKNVKEYIQFKPDFSFFLPVSKLVDVEDNEICLANEIMWSLSFVNELGNIDPEILQSFYDFLTAGGVFRTDDFIEIGGLKASIKLSFWYEFLLRAGNNGVKTFVIPKTGHIHTIEREGSLLSELLQMTEKEKLFWLELAKKEYYFKNERPEKAKYVEKKAIKEIIK